MTSVISTVERCCRPLPRRFLCLWIDLKNVVQIFLVFQAMYGVMLIVLHALLLAPPFNEPRCDWLPGSGPWLELLDLQFSLRIQGSTAYDWEAEMSQYNMHWNFAGTLMGLLMGMVTGILSATIMLSVTWDLMDNAMTRCMEKAWLSFSTVQLLLFIFCNLGKIPTLCIYAEESNQTPRPTFDGGANLAYHTAPPSTVMLFPKIAVHCGVLKMWFMEWTLLVAIVSGLGVWACWSWVNVRIKEEQELEDRLAEQRELQLEERLLEPSLILEVSDGFDSRELSAQRLD